MNKNTKKIITGMTAIVLIMLITSSILSEAIINPSRI